MLVIAQCSHQRGVILEIKDNTTAVVEDLVMIVLRVPNRLLALRVAGTIRASVALETKFVIYVVILDTLEDSTLPCLRVTILQEGQPYGIDLTCGLVVCTPTRESLLDESVY